MNPSSDSTKSGEEDGNNDNHRGSTVESSNVDINNENPSPILVSPEYGPDDDDSVEDGTDYGSRNRHMPKLIYNWRRYVPRTFNPLAWIRWFLGGENQYAQPQSNEELHKNLRGLANCLMLMRSYLDAFGMPEKGGPKDQYKVLAEIADDLYGGGVPLWALDTVLQKVAEGLTGQKAVHWQLFPRRAFAFTPSMGTSMFQMNRGFNISKMDKMEPVVLRLSSFTSNVQGVSNIPARFPNPQEFRRALQRQSGRTQRGLNEDPQKLAKKILALSSSGHGLFYYVNSAEYNKMTQKDDMDEFWKVTDAELELFTRLACQEAMELINALDDEEEKYARYYPTMILMLFRGCASAGASAFWFGGSWYDMIAAGVLAIVIASIGMSSFLSKQERLIFEGVASFVAGLTAGSIALTWSDKTCFSAMAIGGILDILQGFKVVYAVVEVLGKHTVSGAADLLEGILMTSLIAYNLHIGQYVAAAIVQPNNPHFGECSNGIDTRWYFLFVPLAAFSWSGLFTPKPINLLPMTYHGCLAYSINYVLSRYNVSSAVVSFAAAATVSFSAGISSRFTGRQAIGNTVSGIYTLVPGAYLVTSFYNASGNANFFGDILVQATIIGIGAWIGTILCTPTFLGATRALQLSQQVIPVKFRKGQSNKRRFNDDSVGDKSEQPVQNMFHF